MGVLEKAQMFLQKAFNQNMNHIKTGQDSGVDRSGRKERSKKGNMTTIVTHTKPQDIFEKSHTSPSKSPKLKRADHGLDGEEESGGGTFHILNKQTTRLKLYEKKPPKKKRSSTDHHKIMNDSYANLIFER